MFLLSSDLCGGCMGDEDEGDGCGVLAQFWWYLSEKPMCLTCRAMSCARAEYLTEPLLQPYRGVFLAAICLSGCALFDCEIFAGSRYW